MRIRVSVERAEFRGAHAPSHVVAGAPAGRAFVYQGKLRGIDNSRIVVNNESMQVTLSKELEAFIAEKVQNGGYADAGEVVREALRNLKAKDDPAEADSRELAELLLAAVRGPHRALTSEHFARLRSRARRRVAA
jgi:putative addiction module CopG family antidote